MHSDEVGEIIIMQMMTMYEDVAKWVLSYASNATRSEKV